MAKLTEHCPQRCGYCQNAEQLLQRKGSTYFAKADIDHDLAEFKTMIARSRRHSVPQTFLGNLYAGRLDDLPKKECDRETR